MLIEKLKNELAKLPGLGPNSSIRIVTRLLEDKEKLIRLANLMHEVGESIVKCSICGFIDSESPCSICQNPKRDHKTLCIVERINDVFNLEKYGLYNGVYHVLGGSLSAINGINPDKLNIAPLLIRLNDVEEIIIATNPNFEGQSTSNYLAQILKKYNIKVSQLASGVPIGGEISFLDEGTLKAAFHYRRLREI